MNRKYLATIVFLALHEVVSTLNELDITTESGFLKDSRTEIVSNPAPTTSTTSHHYLTERFNCRVSGGNGLSVSCKNISIQDLSEYLPVETKILEIFDTFAPVLRKPLFPHLKNLESLTLYNNRHRYITSKPFTGLESLRRLNLSSNDIIVVKSAFIPTPNLEILDLSDNKIINIITIANALSHLRNLTTLKLNHNPHIRKIFIEEFRPLDNTSLQKVYLFNTTIQHVDRGSFQSMKHLKVLDVSVNYIGNEALENLTSGLSSTPLERLYLQQLLRLTEFPSNALSLLRNSSVMELNLGSNYFPHLPQFPLIPSLEELWLTHCSLKQFDPDAFTQLPGLHALVLSNNEISSLDKSITSVEKLKYLELGSQDVSHFFIMVYSLKNLKNLEYLNLMNMNLGGILDPFIFYGLRNLKTLLLRSTETSIIEDYTFETLGNLDSLDMRSNSLRQFSNFTFYGLSNLKILLLSFNRILFTDTYPFQCCPLLQALALQSNEIQTIPGQTFSTLHKLRKLSLYYNNIVPWNESLFTTNISLETLRLEVNSITHVTKVMLKEFSLVTGFLDLSENPFNCSDCDMEDFQRFMNERRVNFTSPSTSSSDSYICASPKGLQGHRLEDVDFSFHPCEEVSDWFFRLYLIITVCASCIFVAASSLICYSFRWYVRYWIFHFVSVIKERRDSKVEGYQYLYDAFVSYNSADTGWILEHLMPQLEQQQPPLRLCIHERDFEVGRLITENILDAISVSRKVILVLTEEFIKSEWCMFELHMAQHKLFDDVRDALLLIKLKPIHKTFYTKDLLYLTKTRTCLTWVDDPAGQRLFWDKMRKALGVENSVKESTWQGDPVFTTNI